MARVGSVPILGTPAGYMPPPPPPMVRHQSFSADGTSFARMSGPGPDRNGYTYRRQTSIPAYSNSRLRYMSPNPGAVPRAQTRSPAYRPFAPTQRAASVSAIPHHQGFEHNYSSPYQQQSALPPLTNGGYGSSAHSNNFAHGAPYSQHNDPYNGMPPPGSLTLRPPGNAYNLGPISAEGVNPSEMQLSGQASNDMSMGGSMLPSTVSGGESQYSYGRVGYEPSHLIPSMNTAAPPQSSVSAEGIPLESPATMAFNGMMVSASYTPGTAIGWPNPENPTPITSNSGSRFTDPMLEN
jgi:hypothetical protein